ncbi:MULTISPECIES: ABC transporter permease [Vibrio]|uniref:ABC transporter permease n=1 Tax=Vibrio TaxID=662 RepID=UPI001A1B2A7B|nr:ABC transporter permease [Vibrio cidicii]MBG0756330.1 ABC transporter permease [Vibrio cidicii]
MTNLNLRYLFSGAILVLLMSFSIYIKWFSNHDVAAQNLSQVFQFPSWSEPLGTDHFGRSNAARLADAICNSVVIALVSVTLAVTVGLVTGVISGWFGGWFDRIASVLVNMVMALPGLVLVLLLGAIVPGSYAFLLFGIAVTMWAEFFRVIRNKTQRLSKADEFENARLLGFGRLYRFRVHIWPYLKADVFTLACFGAGNAILALAALGFLYVGLRPPQAELGMMMVELFRYYQVAPWVLMQPVLTLMLLIFSFYSLAQTKERLR